MASAIKQGHGGSAVESRQTPGTVPAMNHSLSEYWTRFCSGQKDMTANTAFERAVGQCGPRLARQSGRSAAAQLDR